MTKFSSAIITPTWNNENYTIRCFDSIRKNTNNYKIIWIDNGSEKNSREKVKKFLDENNVPYELIQNEENLGFVKATNQGIKRAMEMDVDYVVLQNNDTEVYDGWLERMIEVAESDERIGLVGPITSPCVSWQSIENLRKNVDEFHDLPKYENNPEEYAKIIKKKYKGEVFESSIQLAFFSTLIKKNVIKEIGILSEDFNVGFGDDDDFCIRAIKAGWKLFFAKDIFVFHNHRTTFRSIYSDEKIKGMLKDNEEIFKKKHSDIFDNQCGNNVVVNKNKILIVFIAHSSLMGGAEKSMIELISGLIKKGLSCHVLLPAEGLLATELRRLSIPFNIIFLPWCADGERKYDINRIDEISKSTLELIDILYDMKPDIVYSNSSVILQGAIASKFLGIKHIWHIREFGELDYDIDFYLPINKRSKFVHDYSDKVIFISDALQKHYHKYMSSEKSELIYNNVKIVKKESQEEVLSKNDKLNLLMVGNVHPAKGQMDAVVAVKILLDRGISNVKLKIVGNRLIEYYNEILSYIEINKLSDHVEFFDFTDNTAEFYQNTDIVLMCSRSEGFGRVTIEAMLFAKPVIGAHAGGTMEIINDGYNGLFYEVGNSEDLAEKILFFYDNKNKIVEFGENGKKYCENKFSDKEYIDRISDIIMKLKGEDDRLVSNIFLHIYNKKENEIKSIKAHLVDTKTQLNIKIGELNNVYVSREWRAILVLQKIVKISIPKNSSRRKMVVGIWRLIKLAVKFLLKIIIKVRSIFFLCVHYFEKFKPKKRRKINKDSRKIVFIDHSYHAKTKSSDFVIDYLKGFFDVEVILDDSWKGGLLPDLSFVDDSYLGIIFWQTIPNHKILKNIKIDNLIYFPMYDQVIGLGYEFWNYYRDLKIVSFSNTLHHKLKKWDFETMYLQYFPKPLEFYPGKKDEVFFWQRLTKINVNLFEKLFSDERLKLHMHKSIDPDQTFVEPTKEQEEKYEISYSEWFDTREEMQEIIKQKGIYFAPREFEGIGLSFLEAMSMGKAVVAVDNPTMNEYIEHGKTGYLFDLKDPKEIDLSNIEEVQKNTYDYMKAGYEKWESEKHRIIDFIEKE